MSADPYRYQRRKTVLPLSWEDFHGICKSLALEAFLVHSEAVLAIGRGGYYAGTLIAHMLEIDVHPVWLSRRINGVITFEDPRWLLEPPPSIEGRRVLVVDEICSSGQTLEMVKARARLLGAADVRCAVLYAHTSGVLVPDYIGLVTDALVLNPWDREIVKGGVFRFHPEYVEALAQQGMAPDPSLLIAATAIRLAKG